MLAGPHVSHGAGAPPPALLAQGCRSLALGGAAFAALPSGASRQPQALATSATDTTTPPIDTAATLRPSSEFVWRPALSAIGRGFERPGRSRDRPRAARRDDATGTSGTSPPSSGRSLSPPSTVRPPHRL